MSATSQLHQISVISPSDGHVTAMLKKYFNLTPNEFVFLEECKRMRSEFGIVSFGLDPMKVGRGRVSIRDAMKQRGFILYNLMTGRWELTGVGDIIVKDAGLTMLDPASFPIRKAQIIAIR